MFAGAGGLQASICSGPLWQGPHSASVTLRPTHSCVAGVLEPSHDKVPTSASRYPLPWILKVLAESRPDPSGPTVDGLVAASVSRESLRGQEPPALRSLGEGIPASSSSLGQRGEPRSAPEQLWPAPHPNVPLDPSLGADPPAPMRAALEPALPGVSAQGGPVRGMPRGPSCGLCPQVRSAPAAQDGLGDSPGF